MVIRQPKTVSKSVIIFIVSMCLGAYISNNSVAYSSLFYFILQFVCGTVAWGAFMFLVWVTVETAGHKERDK